MLTRAQALEIARACIRAKPREYYSEPFEPHEWVLDAIQEGGRNAAAFKPGDVVLIRFPAQIEAGVYNKLRIHLDNEEVRTGVKFVFIGALDVVQKE